MASFEPDQVPEAEAVKVIDDALVVELADGRTISVPLAWYPRLAHASASELAEYQLMGRGRGVHWPSVDEDIAIADLLEGRPSQESHESLEKWLLGRAQAS